MATLAKSNVTTGTKSSKVVGKTTESLTSKGSGTKSSGTQGTPAPIARPVMGRMMFGLVVFFLGTNVINVALAILDHNNFHSKLTKTVLFTVPILGNINGLLMISLPFLVLLFWLLNKFKIMPSQAQMRAGAMAQASARNTTARTAPPQAPAGTGIFASIRSAIMGPTASALPAAKGSTAKTSSTSKTTATSKVSGTGKSATTVGKPTLGKSTTSTVGANAKVGTKKTNDVADGDAADDIYQQVRAQKLAQSRKRRKH